MYQQIVLDLPQLNAEQINLLPYYTNLLTEVGVDQHDYIAMQRKQAAATGVLAPTPAFAAWWMMYTAARIFNRLR